MDTLYAYVALAGTLVVNPVGHVVQLQMNSVGRTAQNLDISRHGSKDAIVRRTDSQFLGNLCKLSKSSLQTTWSSYSVELK